jgi:hypothetical protein
MNDNDLDALLSPGSTPIADRREVVWEQTIRQLRRQKRQRDVLRVSGYVMLVGLGCAVGWWLRPVPDQPHQHIAEQAQPTPTLTVTQNGRTAQLLELDAERTDDLGLSAQLYRLAGDRFLDQGNDIRSAMRCYRQHLQLLDDRGRAVTTSDSWLLISMKQAHPRGEMQ